MKLFTEDIIWTLLRLSMSFILLWTFFDKLFGLGFSTPSEKSWIAGVSPTAGFLKFGTSGFLAPLFNNLSGNLTVDVLFMSGLFLIGVSLLFGIGIKIASFSGSVMMFLIYLSLFPSENNPIIDQHIIYILILIGIWIRSKRQKFGLAEKWSKINFIKKYPVFKH